MKTKRSPKKLAMGNYETLCVYEKSKMVSLNPQYKIEVTTLTSLADKIKDDNRIMHDINSFNGKYFSRR